MEGPREADLLAVAKRAGHPIGPRDLKRWRIEEGVLQRPEQIHLEGVRGSVAIYPPEARDQVRAICHLGEHRYDEMRFRLWWEGRWVDERKLRDTLGRMLDESLEAVRELRLTYPDPYKAAAAVAEWIRASQSRHPFLRLLVRSLGKDEKDLEAVCAAMVLLMYGKDVPWTTAEVGLDEKEEEDLQDVFVRATEWTRATTDSFGDVGPLVAETDVPAAFKRLRKARIFPVENWAELLAGASRDELEQARLDSRAIAEDLRLVAEAAEAVFGRGAFGLGVFRGFRGRRNGFHIRIGLVPMLVGFRRTMTHEEASNFADVAQALHGAVGPAKRIIALRKQLGVGRLRAT